MIELDELQQAWSGLDARLERQDRTLQQLRHRQGLDSTRARLRLVSVGQIAKLLIGVLIVLWAGGYWYDHLGQTHLVVYGVSIHLYGLAVLIASVAQLTYLAGIDYRQPVLDVQKKLLAVRRLRIASERALLIAGFVLWVPVAFIALNAIGVDVWITSPATVWANLAVGVGLAGLVAWLTQRFRSYFERDAVGRSLRAVEAELAELLRDE